jgi:hypothetical protein
MVEAFLDAVAEHGWEPATPAGGPGPDLGFDHDDPGMPVSGSAVRVV